MTFKSLTIKSQKQQKKVRILWKSKKFLLGPFPSTQHCFFSTSTYQNWISLAILLVLFQTLASSSIILITLKSRKEMSVAPPQCEFLTVHLSTSFTGKSAGVGGSISSHGHGRSSLCDFNFCDSLILKCRFTFLIVRISPFWSLEFPPSLIYFGSRYIYVFVLKLL